MTDENENRGRHVKTVLGVRPKGEVCVRYRHAMIDFFFVIKETRIL